MASCEYVPLGKLISPIPPPRSVRSLHPKLFDRKNFIPAPRLSRIIGSAAVIRSTSVWSLPEKIDSHSPAWDHLQGRDTRSNQLRLGSEGSRPVVSSKCGPLLKWYAPGTAADRGGHRSGRGVILVTSITCQPPKQKDRRIDRRSFR